MNSSTLICRRHCSFSTTTGRCSARFVPLVVAKGDRPAAELVEALERLDQVAEERVAPHLAVGDDVEPGVLLQRDGLVDGAILDALELGRRSARPASRSRAGVEQIRPDAAGCRRRRCAMGAMGSDLIFQFVLDSITKLSYRIGRSFRTNWKIEI